METGFTAGLSTPLALATIAEEEPTQVIIVGDHESTELMVVRMNELEKSVKELHTFFMKFDKEVALSVSEISGLLEACNAEFKKSQDWTRDQYDMLTKSMAKEQKKMKAWMLAQERKTNAKKRRVLYTTSEDESDETEDEKEDGECDVIIQDSDGDLDEDNVGCVCDNCGRGPEERCQECQDTLDKIKSQLLDATRAAKRKRERGQYWNVEIETE